MKFNYTILPEAQKELDELQPEYVSLAEKDYLTIQNEGMIFVNTRPVDDFFEIKSGKVRSLFVYHGSKQIIIAVVFLKKSQQTPTKIKELARKRFKKYLNK